MEPDFTDPATYRNGLPAAAFGSSGFGRLEDERLWPKVWVCVGRAEEIPNPGDLLPYTVGVHGIHVQRMADGGLVARLNKAQHGGCHFIPLQCQSGRKTRCGFTSCGYSLDRPAIPAGPDGEPVPEMYQYLGMRPERLPVLPLALQAGLLFVAVDPALGERPPEPGPLPLHAAPACWRTLAGNWKQVAAALLAGDGDEPATCATWHFPNLVLLQGEGETCMVVLQPVAPERTLCRLSLLARTPPADQARAAWTAQVERWAAAAAPADLPQHRWLIELLLAGPARPTGPRPDSVYRSHPRFNHVA
ncbi:aromatic ring-hydroxylating oxygenase subunit alpha [Geminicoccus harenae]|uniref:hypothetical protein n=1 Tax=Geminicoccus harenae TaxID=2498453 RepID=UPI00168A7195|nr:hypothetical protein [Geminicoccus harenae]